MISFVTGNAHAGTDGTEEAVNCTGRSWQYLTADDEWRTNVTFPNEDQTSVRFDGFFNSTGSGEFTVSSIPASIAPAVSDTLYGRRIQVNLTCNQEDDMVDEGDSCVSFQVEFSNYRCVNVTLAARQVMLAPPSTLACARYRGRGVDVAFPRARHILIE